MASQSLGATLSAVMCGGALEVLLLATACSDEMLRACAFEAGRWIRIVWQLLVHGSNWNTPFET